MRDVNILLVEDDAIEALDIKRTLESFGYSVAYVASKGEEAVGKALELMPDLVLMDIILKGEQNGIEAASEIKKLNIPVIYLTAHSEEATIKKAKLTEPYGYLIKPYDVVELKFAIDLALYKSSQERKLKESEERYRMLFENSQVATAITSIDGKVLTANEKFFKMVGYKAEEIHLIDLKSMYQDKSQRNTIIERLKKRGKVREFEVHLLRRDGHAYTNSINVDLIHYQGQDAMLVTAVDITERKKAEEKLKETKDYLDSIYEGAEIPIAVIDITEDKNFMVKSFNAAFERFSGIKRKEGEGKSLEVLLKQAQAQPGAVDHLYRKYEECIEAGHSIQYEESAEFAGEKRWFMTRATPLKNSEGEIYRLIVTPIEITSQKKMEKELQNSEKELQLTVEAISDGVWKWNFKTDELYFSPRYYQMLGYDVNEFPASFESWKALIHPDDLEHALEVAEDYLKQKSDFYENTFRLRTKDGSYKWIKATGRVVERDETGEAIRMIGNHEDITVHQEFEKSYRENEEFLDQIVENIPNMIFVKNADDLTFKRVNKAGEYFFGRPAGELIGKSDYDFFPQKVADFFTTKDREVLKKGKLLDIPEEIIETPDLGQRLLHTKKIPILDEEGNPQYLLGISEDITEIKKAENDLKNSLKEKEVLLREIHHRVKNNMQIISSILNLQKKFLEDEKAQVALTESQNRVKSMAMIHERLYQSPDLTRINISEYIERLVSDLYYTYSISTKQVSLVMDVENLSLNIETAVPCGLIISELVSNSLKYAFPQGRGEISISLKESDEMKELIVGDDGVGFPEEIDFENTQTLGLQLVNNLVKQLDGQIKIEKTNGTKFKVLFKDLEYKKRLNL
ncbi:MAG: PAS domain S-box protein [Methanobacteriaceae archaeon]|nr:PAS domain S-box protein [Methanobacteriaceae archaeon]